MKKLSIDFETRSICDLTTTGAHVYARHPSTRALCACYMFDDGPTIHRWEIWRGHVMPSNLQQALDDPTVNICGWNTNFERLIFKYVIKREIPIERFRCTMARARSMALPGKLGLCARALSMPQQIGAKGMINKWMKPLPDGGWAQDEAEYDQLLAECDDDVRAEAAIGDVVRDLSFEEWRDYHINEAINDRGIPVDLELAAAAQRYAKDELHDICERLNVLTKGRITSPKQFQRIKTWLEEYLPDEVYEDLFLDANGEPKEKVSFDAQTREDLLGDDTADFLVGDVREFVELVHDGGRASSAKFAAMLARGSNEARVYGSFVFNGAGQTGRFCVAAETLVETDGGPKEIVRLSPADKVLTHEGRYKSILNLFYKGKEKMYELRVAGGAVICTARHRILTNKGWMTAYDFADISKKERGDLRAILASAVVDYRTARGRNEDRLPPDTQCASRRYPTRQIARQSEGELLAIEGRRKELDVRHPQGCERYLAPRLFSNLAQRSLCASASRDDGDSTGFAARLPDPDMGSTPYRRRQNEQHTGQFCALHQTRSSETTRGTFEAFEAVGDRGVWDIEVEGDHSYVAQGLIHHNSGTGVQTQNLIRAKLENIENVVEAILKGVPRAELQDIASYRPDGTFVFDKAADKQLVEPYNVLTILGRTLKAAIVADEGKTLLWGDWKSIEAVVNPWLSKENSASELLDYFAAGGDLYIRQAAHTYGVAEKDVTPGQRQAGGKVPVLLSQFGGGEGAILRGARLYNTPMDEATATMIKRAWREANPWAQRFWSALEIAMYQAVRRPETVYDAGRIKYMMAQDVLWCLLPSGRMLAYPFAKISLVRNKWGDEQEAVTCIKGAFHPKKGSNHWPRMQLWGGIACENVTQGEAASLLRWGIRELWDNGWPLIGHTHDEILEEIDEAEADEAAAVLRDVMTTGPEWAAGLPLLADISMGYVYGQGKEIKTC